MARPRLGRAVSTSNGLGNLFAIMTSMTPRRGETWSILLKSSSSPGHPRAIGRATAREFATHGCKVALLARGRAGLEAAAREVEQLGGEALTIPIDVADYDAVERAAEQVAEQFGSIDIWVNNAFAGIFSRFMDMSLDEYRRVTDVTYFGQIHGTRAALKHMLPRDSGTIVLVGSALAYRGIPLQSAYCAAKHAIQGFQEFAAGRASRHG